MALGIALGAFAEGLRGGVELGTGLQKNMRENRSRRQLQAIDKEGKAAFEAEGGGDAEAWGNFYNRAVVPKKVAALLEQGDLAGAEAFRKWSDSESARSGGRFFASGVLKGQAGDMKGAISDFIQAGKVQGYGENWQVGTVTELDGGGYHVEIKGADGADLSQDFKTPEDVLRFGATYLNPEAAYQSWRDAETKRAETAMEVEKARQIEANKQAIGTQTAAERRSRGLDQLETNIQTEEAKADLELETDERRRAAGLPVKGDAKDQSLAIRKQAFEELKDTDAFLEATEADQKRMIDERAAEIGTASGVGAGTGGGTAPEAPAARRTPIVVDEATGQVVEGPVGTSGLTSPAGTSPTGAKRERVSAGRGRGGGSSEGRGTTDAVDRLVERARQMLNTDLTGEQKATLSTVVEAARGGSADPLKLRNQLRHAGIPPEAWPEEVKKALRPGAGRGR